jgi:hypothetical protein
VMNDSFEPTNSWDGPRQHGCEVEILHHETKGSNHFIQIVGRRKFTIRKVIAPALPPMNDPMFESHIEEDGLFPDLQTLLELIPEGVGHSKLYISGEVEYHPHNDSTSIELQEILKDILNHVLTRIGALLRIEEDVLEQWIQERVGNSVNESPYSAYTVAALVLNELEAKQQILACDTIEEAVEELVHHVSMVEEEE